MTQTDYYNRLTDEQKVLINYLEENNRAVYLFEQDGKICAEVENWTDGGVDMIIVLMPFTIDELKKWHESFDIDEEIGTLRQDERYRNAFTIRESVNDFDGWHNDLKQLIENYYQIA